VFKIALLVVAVDPVKAVWLLDLSDEGLGGGRSLELLLMNTCANLRDLEHGEGWLLLLSSVWEGKPVEVVWV